MKLRNHICGWMLPATIALVLFSNPAITQAGTITWANAYHAVTTEGSKTFLDLGVDAPVATAFVRGPDNAILHTFSESDSYGDGYFYAVPGPPVEGGEYTFEVTFTDGTSDTRVDTQGTVIDLPIVYAEDITVDDNHTTTPTFSWPDVAPGNWYRLRVTDDLYTTLYTSSREQVTSMTVPAGILPSGIEIRARVEVHDSGDFDTLDNRSNGDYLRLDTQFIAYAGVNQLNTPDGLQTSFVLGPNFPPRDIAAAYVTDPGGFRIDFGPGDYYPAFGEYYLSSPGAPAPGDYVFTIELLDGTYQSVTDNQIAVDPLPIITAEQYQIIGGDGVTPTFRWPAAPDGVLFYRARIFDEDGNIVVNTARRGGTALVIAPDQLNPLTTYQFRVEIHDSISFYTLQNRSNGEYLNFTTGPDPAPPAGPLEVFTVPWVATAPLIPHDAYAGKAVALKAVAKGGDGTYSYEWDFEGDGVFDYSTTTDNPYDLSTRHDYGTHPFDRVYIARVRVTSGGETVTAEYPVRVHANPTRGVRVNVAIDESLWWLHQQLVRFESGPVSYGYLTNQALGATGAAVQAWENQGHLPGGDPANPYVEDVQRGLNSILSQTHPYPIYTEDGRDPDTLVNGYGLHSILQSQLYETGIVLMALASSGDPSLTCETGGFGLLGRTFGDIAQDMADFLAFAQNEPDVGVWRGGWRYAPNYGQSDMSVTQWPVIGLEAAESNFGTVVPDYVKDELAIYLEADQDADGGFGYTSPGGNVARTGAGIACLAWIGRPADDPDVQLAMGFIDTNWSFDHIGNFYAMYAVMKGMRGFEPDLEQIGLHDWYDEYADYLVSSQQFDGAWNSFAWYDIDLSTATGVLILTPEIFQPPPVAVADADPREAAPGTQITFDHSASFHRDPARTLTTFRWDFDEDGVWDCETGDIEEKCFFTYNDDIGCGEEVEHRVILQVADDLGNTDTDDETVVIRINLYNHPPVADGDPTDSFPNYNVTSGETFLLDAGQSYDPDEGEGDFIVSYEWDTDNDGEFDVTGETVAFTVPLTWEPGTTHTVTLRVTDDGTWADDCPGSVSGLSDETTVVIAVSSSLDCTKAEPTIAMLWPPNHTLVGIDIIGITDDDGIPAAIVITGITQDEPVDGLGDGDTAPDGAGVGTSTAWVRAERSGPENGRVYQIVFEADDGYAACEGTVNVAVPHSKKSEAVDDGQYYDSTLE